MASELRVDKIIPSSGASIGIGTTNGTTTVVNNLSVGSSVTASAFYGDGSNLTGAGPTLTNGADNRVITASSASAIQGESSLTYDALELHVNNASPKLKLTDTDNSGVVHLKNVGGVGILTTTDATIFETAGTERLRIKSDGKVNITSGGALSGSHPPGDLNIVGTNFLTMTPNDNANASDNEVLGVVAFLPYAAGSIAAASAKIEAVAESGQSGSSNATSLRFYNKNSSTGPGNSGTERMRITSNANGTGAVYINQTSEVSGANSHLVVNNAVAIVTGSTFRSFYLSGNGNAYFWNGSNQPYISSGGSFTNASDVSLKKDITDLTYGIDVLKNLKPRKYKMKADDKEQIGFIAQEVEADVPEVVEASETPNGDQHKGLAYGNLTAVLTKALQEAVTKIETLEAKVAALEGS